MFWGRQLGLKMSDAPDLKTLFQRDSKKYLLALLHDWHIMNLEAITILDHDTGEPFKQVWRGIARRQARKDDSKAR